MPKRILTQEDIDNNLELADAGLKAGDEVDIPEQNELTDGATDDPADDDTGGSNPPPSKERP